MNLQVETDKMELYFHPMSGCSRRVVALLAHLEIPFTPKVIDLNAGAQSKPAYLAINPGGRVPTLVEVPESSGSRQPSSAGLLGNTPQPFLAKARRRTRSTVGSPGPYVTCRRPSAG